MNNRIKMILDLFAALVLIAVVYVLSYSIL